MRVLLADDHALVRAGIHSLLQGMREVQVVGDLGGDHVEPLAAPREQPGPDRVDAPAADGAVHQARRERAEPLQPLEHGRIVAGPRPARTGWGLRTP